MSSINYQEGFDLAKKENTSEKIIQSVDRAVEILECFNEKETELSLAVICEKVSLNKSTALGIINTLIRRQYLAKNLSTGRYCLGKAILAKHNEAVTAKMNQLYDLGSVYVMRLFTKYRMEVLLYGYANNVLFLLDRIIADVSKPPARVTYQLSYHASAPGKLVLTQYTSLQLDKYLESSNYAFTEATKTSPEAIRKDCRATLERGYAIENGEVSEGVTAYAVPIYDKSGTLFGTICCTGASDNMESIRTLLVDDLLKCSEELTQKLFS